MNQSTGLTRKERKALRKRVVCVLRRGKQLYAPILAKIAREEQSQIKRGFNLKTCRSSERDIGT